MHEYKIGLLKTLVLKTRIFEIRVHVYIFFLIKYDLKVKTSLKYNSAILKDVNVEFFILKKVKYKVYF